MNEADERSRTADAEPRTGDDAFGAVNLKKDREREQRELVSTPASLSFTKRGKYVVTLENGQVWQQIQGDTNSLYVPKARAGGIPVTIKKGSLNSHRLRLGKAKRSITVRRTK